MAKVRLCSKDEGNLVEQLNSFSEALSDYGIEGIVQATFSSNGDISASFAVNPGTILLIDIEKDGNKKTLEYHYE